MPDLNGKVMARNVMVGNSTETDMHVKLEVKEKDDGGFEGTMVATGYGDHQIGDGNKTFSNDILLDLTNTTNNSEAWCMMDTWLRKHLIAPPPAPTNGQVTSEATNFTVSWTNPPRVELGFLDQEVPHIDEIVVKMRLQDSNVSLEDRELDAYWASATTINTGSRECSALKLLTDGTTSTLVGNTYHQAPIQPFPAVYDFRIYGVNKNSAMTKNYLYVWDGKTTSIGPPNQPTSLQQTSGDTSGYYRSFNISYTKPSDHDTDTPGDQTVPPIQNYHVSWEFHSHRETANGLKRFNHASFTDGRDGTSTPAGTSATVGSIYPFANYNVTVKAKNTQNDSYSDNNPTTLMTTAIPANAGKMSTSSHNAFAGSYKQSISSPRFLDGTLATNENNSTTNIVKAASIASNFVPNSDNSTNIGIFHDDYACSDNTRSTVCKFNLTMTMKDGATGDAVEIDSVTSNLGGFGTASNNGTNDGANMHLQINIANDGDYYGTDQYASGFWQKCNVNTTFGKVPPVYTGSSITNKPTLYQIQMQQELVTDEGPNQFIDCSPMGFYVDSLSLSPVLQHPCIYGVKNSNRIAQVCGVNTYKISTIFQCQAGLQNVCGYFLRNDQRHLHAQLVKGSSGSTYSGSAVYVNKGHPYYDAPATSYERPTTLHNPDVTPAGSELLPNATDIYWTDIEVTTQSSNFFHENVNVQFYGYNTVNSTNQYGNYRDTSGNTRKIRFDTKSLNIATNTLASATNSNGQLMYGGDGDFPTVASITSFDHTKSLVADYTAAHQLIDGKFYGPGGTLGFENYVLDYFWDSKSPVTTFDYTSALSTGYRWTTFKITKNWTSSVNKLNVALNDASGFTLNKDDVTANNHKMYLYDPTLGKWLDMAKAIPGTGLTGAVDGTANALPGTSIGNRVVQVAPASGLITYYVRVGWPNNQNNNFSNCTISQA